MDLDRDPLRSSKDAMRAIGYRTPGAPAGSAAAAKAFALDELLRHAADLDRRLRAAAHERVARM